MSKSKPLEERYLVNKKMREERNKKGLTQEEAAQKMGMLRDTYQRMESNGKITYDRVLLFCDSLDVPRSTFKCIFEDKPAFGEEPKTLGFHSPLTIEKQLYGDKPVLEKKKNENMIMSMLNSTENCLINMYRSFSKADQKAVRDFMNNLK